MSVGLRLCNPLTELERCPQCGIYKPTLEFLSADVDLRGGKSAGPGWAVYRCSGCYDIVAFKARLSRPASNQSWVSYLHVNDFRSVAMLPAGNEKAAEALPKKAATYLQQAIDAIHAPDGSVMLAGSAVDAMLKDKGYKDGSVYGRIQNAVEDHLLTKEMGEWAHAVRLQANQPRHADEEDPHATIEEARQAMEFAKALGEFLFVLPARIASGTQAAEAASSNSGL